MAAWEAWLERFATYVATKVSMQQALNKDSEMFRACREAIVEASEPLFARAQQAGEIRADISFDDALRMLSGIVASAYCDDAQRDRVLQVALDGLRPFSRFVRSGWAKSGSGGGGASSRGAPRASSRWRPLEAARAARSASSASAAARASISPSTSGAAWAWCAPGCPRRTGSPGPRAPG